jgi:hypothetical protein
MRTALALLLAVVVAGAPALTYAHNFGGGGGGHFSGGGGGHFSGGGGRSSGGGHFSGAMGGHFAGGGHFAAPAHFAGYGGAHFGASRVAGGGLPHSPLNSGHFVRPGSSSVAGGWHGGGWHGGGWHGGDGWHGGWHGWHGGYWGGVFWPHVWFGPGWAWFLPVLPLGYATFWWGGMPYYYWNNLYYTWSPGDNGYVVTDPPPVAGDTAEDATGDAGSPQYGAAPEQYHGAGQSGSGADVYLYPRNGQSTEQTQNDRY